jgi:predicted DsbA family dithiol-disulfide isomerase
MNEQREWQSASGVRALPASARRPVIQIVSDVVCPWCFIGKRRLEKALGLLERRDVPVRWKPFQLNPDLPKKGVDRQAFRTRRFGSVARSQELEARVAAAGAEEGIEFRFNRIQKVPNTFDAHRLLWYAGREGVQDAVAENLFRAYFIEAEDVGDTGLLKRVGVASGLDPARVGEFLATGLGAEEIIAEETAARRSGVQSVPTFFVDGEPVTAGAHKAELLAGMLGPALGPALAQCSPETGACG